MKVCLLNDSFPPVIDGVATAVTNYASILTETGRAQIVVGTPRCPGADYGSYPYRVVTYPSVGALDGYRAGNPLAIKPISQLSQFDPDIIHVHCPVMSAVVGRIIRNETYAPLIFTYHTKFDVDIARAMRSKHLQKEAIRMLVNNISACDEVWTVSHGAGDNLRSLGYEGEIRVVSNGVDFEKGLADSEFVNETVKDFDLPERVPMFLFVGRILKYKGLPLILDAMRRLSANGVDYRMVFIGSGSDAEAMQQMTREYGISLDIRSEEGKITSEIGGKFGKFIFTGPVYDRNQLRAWNTRADLFLFPSTYDTNGIVVREAAACGLASVLVAGSCAAEGITHGRNGYLVEENGDAIAALLQNLTLEDMKSVGEHAMNEIYISWHDSVICAADRYQVILEKKNAGQLKPRRNNTSDKLLSVTTEAMDMLYDTFHFPKAVYYGVTGSVRALYDSVSDGMQSVYDSVSDGMQSAYTNFSDEINSVYDELQYSMRENLYGMQENYAEAKRYLKQKRNAIRVGIHETRDTIRDELREGWDKVNGSKK